METPWGYSQHCDVVRPGVFVVDTAGHGGVLIMRRVGIRYLTQSARKLAWEWDDFYAYEEDCAIYMPMYEHPDWFVSLYQWDHKTTVEELKQRSKEGIERWFPEYDFSELAPTPKTAQSVVYYLNPTPKAIGYTRYRVWVDGQLMVDGHQPNELLARRRAEAIGDEYNCEAVRIMKLPK